MAGTISSPVRPDPPPVRRTGLGRWLLLATVTVVVAVLVVVAFVVGHGFQGGDPQFPSLAANPDPSLHGTVAYLDDSTGCVRIRSVSGRPARNVYCLPAQDPAVAKEKGKLVGPQLRWRPDGRLEVTMFRMPVKPGPGYHAGWQKLVDVRTGKVQDVPAADVPATPAVNAHPAVNAAGERISWTSEDGKVEVLLHRGATTRTLLSAHGPFETYRLGAAFWGPEGRWVLADDGRILVITTGAHPVTRVLTEESASVAFESQYSRFAVTGADLLGASG